MTDSQIKEYLVKTCTPEEARQLNPLALAFIGDAVYSTFVRRYLIARGDQNVHRMTRESVRYVRADAQAHSLKAVEDALTPEEQDIVRWGRNTRSTPPKNADVMDYRYATALETLLGFLELTGQQERAFELTVAFIQAIDCQSE